MFTGSTWCSFSSVSFVQDFVGSCLSISCCHLTFPPVLDGYVSSFAFPDFLETNVSITGHAVLLAVKISHHYLSLCKGSSIDWWRLSHKNSHYAIGEVKW